MLLMFIRSVRVTTREEMGGSDQADWAEIEAALHRASAGNLQNDVVVRP